MTDQGKNNTKIVLAAIGIVTLVVTLIIAPLVKGSSSNVEILQRLAKVETNTENLKAGMDRIEKKLDSHVDKGN